MEGFTLQCWLFTSFQGSSDRNNSLKWAFYAVDFNAARLATLLLSQSIGSSLSSEEQAFTRFFEIRHALGTGHKFTSPINFLNDFWTLFVKGKKPHRNAPSLFQRKVDFPPDSGGDRRSGSIVVAEFHVDLRLCF
jgi:hypothetical protein